MDETKYDYPKVKIPNIIIFVGKVFPNLGENARLIQKVQSGIRVANVAIRANAQSKVELSCKLAKALEYILRQTNAAVIPS